MKKILLLSAVKFLLHALISKCMTFVWHVVSGVYMLIICLFAWTTTYAGPKKTFMIGQVRLSNKWYTDLLAWFGNVLLGAIWQTNDKLKMQLLLQTGRSTKGTKTFCFAFPIKILVLYKSLHTHFWLFQCSVHSFCIFIQAAFDKRSMVKFLLKLQ